MAQFGDPCIKPVLRFHLKQWTRGGNGETNILFTTEEGQVISPNNGRETVEKQLYLQMIDVLFCIKVYSPSFLFNGHDRESDIDASMDLPFLNLKSRD